MGRPVFVPTEKDRQQVLLLAGMGLRDLDIALVLGISPPTVRKYFESELAVGHIKANAQVAQSLYKQATHPEKPNVTAAIFWLKCRADWREYPEEESKKAKKNEAAKKTAETGRYEAPAAPTIEKRQIN